MKIAPKVDNATPTVVAVPNLQLVENPMVESSVVDTKDVNMDIREDVV